MKFLQALRLVRLAPCTYLVKLYQGLHLGIPKGTDSVAGGGTISERARPKADGKNEGPKAWNCDLCETRSGIRTTKMKKKKNEEKILTTTTTLSRTTKSDTFFTAEFSHFLTANFFSRKWSPKIFSIFLH